MPLDGKKVLSRDFFIDYLMSWICLKSQLELDGRMNLMSILDILKILRKTDVLGKK
jgi:hypothetical protein